MNMVILYGHLGSEPELKNFNGNKLCRFSIATNETYKDKTGVVQTSTQWHRIDVWGNQAESCAKYLKKGSEALVSGKIEYRKNPETGVTYSNIKADRVQFLGGKKQEEYKPSTQNPNDWINTDDIPF